MSPERKPSKVFVPKELEEVVEPSHEGIVVSETVQQTVQNALGTLMERLRGEAAGKFWIPMRQEIVENYISKELAWVIEESHGRLTSVTSRMADDPRRLNTRHQHPAALHVLLLDSNYNETTLTIIRSPLALLKSADVETVVTATTTPKGVFDLAFKNYKLQIARDRLQAQRG